MNKTDSMVAEAKTLTRGIVYMVTPDGEHRPLGPIVEGTFRLEYEPEQLALPDLQGTISTELHIEYMPDFARFLRRVVRKPETRAWVRMNRNHWSKRR